MKDTFEFLQYKTLSRQELEAQNDGGTELSGLLSMDCSTAFLIQFISTCLVMALSMVS